MAERQGNEEFIVPNSSQGRKVDKLSDLSRDENSYFSFHFSGDCKLTSETYPNLRSWSCQLMILLLCFVVSFNHRLHAVKLNGLGSDVVQNLHKVNGTVFKSLPNQLREPLIERNYKKQNEVADQLAKQHGYRMHDNTIHFTVSPLT
ncbi:hypothetical protein RDI58_011655 [Solanum bulbocastanum]|uniref:Uncharacterized protein n=1 Tax=Solanum bulbocastanum TaxID=147425 RepID=A0AAN8TT65_SOLBU